MTVEAKQRRRQCERLWRKTGLTVHRDMYREMKRRVNILIDQTKSSHLHNIISENSGDTKKMFSVVGNLLGKKKPPTLPPDKDSKELVKEFSTFFMEKIARIRASITTDHIPLPPEKSMKSLPSCSLEAWDPVSHDQLRKIIMSSPSKSCGLDPLPTNLLKQCVTPLLPSISTIVNNSLETGIVPSAFKLAHVTPLIKKPTLDPAILSNYRPVSNLPFVSKVLEKVVSSQLISYLEVNGLQEPLQSAYRKDHSTETALVRVQNDVMAALGGKKACLMVLLDLSAAFDTVDHSQLLRTLRDLGVKGSAFKWFECYLSNREQIVCIGRESSTPQKLKCGVPQGSVLGPVLFTVYTSSLGQLFRSHSMNYHFYADDSQLYLLFQPHDIATTVRKVEECITSVRQWMLQKSLKMNDSKTEVLLISSKQLARKINCPSIIIGDSGVAPSVVAKSLGVIMDRHALMEEHITSVCKSARFHLYNIGRIRKYITREATEQLIHALITSKLDYCNALLYGLPNKQIHRLQRLQNIAARIVTLSKKSCHITPVLHSLHWLPVSQRIKFKVLLLVFKCQISTAPPYLQELIRPYVPRRNLRSAGQYLLEVPPSSNSYGARAFGAAGPRLWNELPLELRNACSITAFKSRLKTHLFKEFYSIYI